MCSPEPTGTQTKQASARKSIGLDAVYISFYILAVWDWQKEKTGIFCRHGTGDLVLFGILIESNLSTGVGGYGFDGAKQCKVCDPTAFLFTGKGLPSRTRWKWQSARFSSRRP